MAVIGQDGSVFTLTTWSGVPSPPMCWAAPELYIALGISGAAQHTGGLGTPDHVVSVNTDPSCPMTAMADLGIVADAPAVLRELAKRLGVTDPSGANYAG